MVDLATLTGAIIVALGHEYAGLFANNEELANRLIGRRQGGGRAAVAPAARRRLRQGHRFRHRRHEEYRLRPRRRVDSPRAQFIQRFVNDVPWAHLDIAGIAWSKKDAPTVPKGATAYRRAAARPAGRRLLRAERLIAAGRRDDGDPLLSSRTMTLERALPQILEKVLARGERVVVMAGSSERVEALNAALWTYNDRSFLPHGSSRDGFAEDQPIWLTTAEREPQRRRHAGVGGRHHDRSMLPPGARRSKSSMAATTPP